VLPEPLDTYGDPLPVGAVVRLGTVRLRHGNHVDSVVYSADGKMLASQGRYESVVRLWDPATGKQVAEVGGEKDCILSFCLSADGKTLATTASDKIALWEVRSGTKSREWRADTSSIVFSPEGTTIGSVSRDGIHLWEAATGKELQFIKHDTKKTRLRDCSVHHGLAFSTDGKTLADTASVVGNYVATGAGDGERPDKQNKHIRCRIERWQRKSKSPASPATKIATLFSHGRRARQ
jgi:WD40 repeat protein